MADEAKDDGVALCASCDRCRLRKTKCDGERPCGNCAAKYMKKYKLTRCGSSAVVLCVVFCREISSVLFRGHANGREEQLFEMRKSLSDV
jgi:hypothetical protein